MRPRKTWEGSCGPLPYQTREQPKTIVRNLTHTTIPLGNSCEIHGFPYFDTNSSTLAYFQPGRGFTRFKIEAVFFSRDASADGCVSATGFFLCLLAAGLVVDFFGLSLVARGVFGAFAIWLLPLVMVVEKIVSLIRWLIQL